MKRRRRQFLSSFKSNGIFNRFEQEKPKFILCQNQGYKINLKNDTVDGREIIANVCIIDH